MLLHTEAVKLEGKVGGWAFETIVISALGVLLVLFVGILADPDAVAGGFAGVVGLSPIWLPLFLGTFFISSWVHYIRYGFWFSQKMVLLEIQLPQEVEKSPAGMELFLASIHNSGGETTFIQRIWKGQFRAIWSLEIASNEGRVGFYLHGRESLRSVVEARLYGQFPGAKITEVDDYVAKIPYDQATYGVFGSEYLKSSANPQALPIKTYVDFGLDKDPDEELKIDPITSILELMGQIKKGEYYWMQIIIKARKKDEWYGFYYNKSDDFVDPAKKEITRIVQAAAKRSQEFAGGAAKDIDGAVLKQAASRGLATLSEGEKDRVSAIERSMTKVVFECGIRVIYMAKEENFVGSNIPPLITFFSSFRSQNADSKYNSLGVTGHGGTAYFDYPWQDFMNIRKKKEERHLIFRYKHRAYFYVPYDQKPVFMTPEELATVWHFPGSSVQVPGLNRVSSRASEAPGNLPTLPS